MHKLRDFDAELKALDEKARRLKDRKLRQLGELAIATGADALTVEELAGALLSAVDTDDLEVKEDWRARGVAFFQRPARRPAHSGGRGASGGDANGGGA